MNEKEIANRSRLTLEKRHQLIDLNKEYVNFDITFECKAVDATKDFEIIVVNQEQLNTVDLTNLTMKRTKGGYISGNIIADEDKYQNYFLILRSAMEEPVEVDMEIKIRPIEPKATGFQQTDIPPYEQPHVSMEDMAMTPHCPVATSNSHVIFMVVGLLIIGGAMGYYFWKNSKKHHKQLLSMEDDAHSVISSRSSSSRSSSSTDEQGILDTLISKSKST